MPKCSECGRDYADKTNLKLVRDAEGKWILRCRECLSKQSQEPETGTRQIPKRDTTSVIRKDTGPRSNTTSVLRKDEEQRRNAQAQAMPASQSADAAHPSTGTRPANASNHDDGAGEGAASHHASHSSSIETHAPGSPKRDTHSLTKGTSFLRQREEDMAFSRLRTALDEVEKELVLDAEGQKKHEEETGFVQKKRNCDRFDVKLGVEFAFLRDHSLNQGVVKDLSQSGMRFLTNRELQKGQILRTMVFAPDQKKVDERDRVETFCEVMRTTKLQGDDFEVGVRFIRPTGLDMSERRHHRRLPILVPLFYVRDGGKLIRKGEVLDISQGGLRIRLRESVKAGERIEVMLRTEPPAFAHADLSGYAKVLRQQFISKGTYEIGVAFEKLHVKSVASANQE